MCKIKIMKCDDLPIAPYVYNYFISSKTTNMQLWSVEGYMNKPY